MDTPGHLTRLLSLVCSVFDAHSAVLFLPESEGGITPRYRLSGYFSLSDAVLAGTLVEGGKSIVGWIARENKPMLVSDFDKKRSRLGYYEEKHERTIKAFIGTPLPGGGALCLDSKRTHSFGEKDLKLLQLFARHLHEMQGCLGQARAGFEEHRYHNALCTLSTLRHEVKSWPLFLDASLEVMLRATGFGYAYLATRGPLGLDYAVEGENGDENPRLTGTSFPIGAGLTGWVFKNGVVLSSGDASVRTKGTSLFGAEAKLEPPAGYLLLPLIFGGTVRGVLGFSSSERYLRAHSPCAEEGAGGTTVCSFDGSLTNFCTAAASHLALFFETLYLKSRLAEAQAALASAQAQTRTTS